jgi:hypothetical protein
LDYYNARYYDPTARQFASADTAQEGGLNRYAYVAGNPTTNTDPSGHMCTSDSVACAVGKPTPPPPYTGPAPKVGPNTSTGVGNDGGIAAMENVDLACTQSTVRCVIFVEGTDINLLARPGSYIEEWNPVTQARSEKFGWGQHWLDKLGQLGAGTGAAFYAANSVPDGAAYLHDVLSELASWAYTGKVALVGHSNGAGAIFHYFATADGYPGDAKVRQFVAMDAPIPQSGTTSSSLTWFAAQYVLEDDYWSQWDTALVDMRAANTYIQKHGILGRYAWEQNDVLTSDVGCACQKQPYNDSSDPLGSHTFLLTVPDPNGNTWLLDGLNGL